MTRAPVPSAIGPTTRAGASCFAGGVLGVSFQEKRRLHGPDYLIRDEAILQKCRRYAARIEADVPCSGEQVARTGGVALPDRFRHPGLSLPTFFLCRRQAH